MPLRTALIVPVPEATGLYAGTPGVPPHVTVLFPWLDPDDIDETALRELLTAFAAFDFSLVAVEQFEDGVRWLRPEPSRPFSELTEAVWRRWPERPPYEGAFDEVIPHLTITEPDPPLPIAARASEVTLIQETEPGGAFAARLRFPLG
jgi:2'-5' RNA ligase superfamily protein